MFDDTNEPQVGYYRCIAVQYWYYIFILLAVDCAIYGHHIKDERYPKFEERLYAVQVLMCRPYHTKIPTLDVEDI